MKHAADGCQGARSPIKEELGKLLQALGRHLLDPLDDFLQPEAAVEIHVHLSEPGHPATGALEAEEEIAFELFLGAPKLRGTYRLIPDLPELGLDVRCAGVAFPP